MFNDRQILNPLNDFIYSLPKEKCGDVKLDWMIKNLQANFYKLYGCSINIAQIQKDYLPKHEQGKILNLNTFSLNSVEYFFIKIYSIFEICYQAYFELCSPNKPKGKEKHKFLDEQFMKYNENTGRNIRIDWYDSVNRVRNFIVHGGYSIKTFTDDDRLLFQAYNSSLEEQLHENYGFFKKNSNLIYIDLYTNFYTRIVHWYIQEFFLFVLHSLGASPIKDEDMSKFDLMTKKSSSVLLYEDVDLFIAISELMDAQNPNSAA